MSTIDSTSTDLAIRCFGPPPISEAYRLAAARVGDSRDVLGRRLALIETTLHYLVGVLATEVAGLGLDPPQALHTLVGKLNRASWGDWSAAAEELARAAVASGRPLVAPEVAGIFCRSEGRRAKPRGTPTLENFVRLIGVRNRIAHPDTGALIPNVREAERVLRDEVDQPLRSILTELRTLRSTPLMYSQRSMTLRDGTRRTELLRFRGTDFDELAESGECVRTPDETPFLVSAVGDVLLLSPWIVVDYFGPSIPQVRVLWKAANGAFLYSQPSSDAGCSPCSRDDEPCRTPDGLLKRAPGEARQDRAVAETAAARLRSLTRVTPFVPSVPGLTVEQLLGRGASSTVYAARATTGNQRMVALKILSDGVAQNARQRQRLQQEFAIMSRLEHESIARVFDHGEEEATARPYLVLEYVSGNDLQSQIEKGGALRATAAALLAERVLAALQIAHESGVVHRDIKPSNIMVDEAGNVKLIDFGIALTDWHRDRQTRTLDAAVGTALFAAPEQRAGGLVDERADIYAVGRLLEFMITGQAPGQQLSDVPSGLLAVIRRAVHADREQRFATADEMRASLETARMQGLSGAPTHEGDVLDENYRVLQSLGAVGDGLWAFNGKELTSEQEVALLIAEVRPAASAALGELVRSADRAMLRSVDYRALLRTRDGIQFVVLGSEGDSLDRVRALVERRPHKRSLTTDMQRVDLLAPLHADERSTTEWTPTPGLLPDGQFRGPLAPYLAGLRFVAPRADARLALLDAHETVSVLAQVLAAQTWALLDRSDDLLPGVLVWPPRHLELERLDPLVRNATFAVAYITRRIEEFRNRLAHALPGEAIASVASLVSGMQIIFQLVASAANLVTPERLTPLVTQLPDGQWACLMRRTSDLCYVILSNERPGHAPVPSDLARHLAELGVEAKGATFQSVLADSRKELEKHANEELRAWALAGTVREGADVAVHGSGAMIDFLVEDKHGRPLALAEIESIHGSAIHERAQMDRLWAASRAVRARYAGLRTPWGWRWYLTDAERGLVRLSGWPEITLSELKHVYARVATKMAQLATQVVGNDATALERSNLLRLLSDAGDSSAAPGDRSPPISTAEAEVVVRSWKILDKAPARTPEAPIERHIRVDYAGPAQPAEEEQVLLLLWSLELRLSKQRSTIA